MSRFAHNCANWKSVMCSSLCMLDEKNFCMYYDGMLKSCLTQKVYEAYCMHNLFLKNMAH